MAVVDRIRNRVAVRSRLRTASFDSPAVARLRRRRHVIVLGDSHTLVFRDWRPDGWWFDVVTVGGATASGIRNPNSVTEALPRFRARLARTMPWQPVMVMLGEVDCGYIIWRRARSESISVQDSLRETLDRYTEFLRDEVARGRPVMVMSVPLPTLPDDSSSLGKTAQRRADVQVSQRDRTEMTLRFNRLVSELCDAEGWTFVDSTSGQLDPATGFVRGDLVRHGSGDHHLRDEPYRALIARALGIRA